MSSVLIAYCTEKQVKKQEVLKDEDLIVIQLNCKAEVNSRKPIKIAFGYVTEVIKSTLRDIDYIDEKG